MKEMLDENFVLFEGVNFGAVWLTGMRKSGFFEHLGGFTLPKFNMAPEKLPSQ